MINKSLSASEGAGCRAGGKAGVGWGKRGLSNRMNSKYIKAIRA